MDRAEFHWDASTSEALGLWHIFSAAVRAGLQMASRFTHKPSEAKRSCGWGSPPESIQGSISFHTLSSSR